MTSTKEGLVGVWQVVSYEVRQSSGHVIHPLGPDPIGQLSYDADGNMSAHLMERGLARLSGEAIRLSIPEPGQAHQLSPAVAQQIANAWRGYVGYWGTYTVDEAAGAIHHQVVGASVPNMVETKQTRHFKLEGNRLTLEADLTLGRGILIWERVRRGPERRP